METNNGTDEGVSLGAGLTREEDDELRRLNFLAKVGTLSERKRQRILELRILDRRVQIRPPREFHNERAPNARTSRRASRLPSRYTMYKVRDDTTTAGWAPRPYAGNVDATGANEQNRPARTLSEVRTELDQMAALRLLAPFKPLQSAYYDQLGALEKDQLRVINREP